MGLEHTALFNDNSSPVRRILGGSDIVRLLFEVCYEICDCEVVMAFKVSHTNTESWSIKFYLDIVYCLALNTFSLYFLFFLFLTNMHIIHKSSCIS